MRVTFESEDPQEIKRLAKSEDLAGFIWALVNNGWRDFKNTNYDYEEAWEKIHELLDEYQINISELYD